MAAAGHESSEAAAALEYLCSRYWYPIYAYVRRRGYGLEDAQDLTQEFFARLLEKRSFSGAAREKGRFRSFLLGALKHFLSDAKDRATAQKRGGGREPVSWEQECAEQRFCQEPAEEFAPDKLFDRRWALMVLEKAASDLRAQYEAEGRLPLFDALKSYVTSGEVAPSYSEAALSLGLSDSALKSAVYRLRQRYHRRVRQEVTGTVADPGELEEEIRYLMSLFSRPAATL